MSKLEIFCKSDGLIIDRPKKKRESKLREINSDHTFRLVFQNKVCIRYYNDLYPDLFDADWNTELYYPLDEAIELTFTYGDVTYKKKHIFIDGYLLEEFDIYMGRKFFNGINLARQRESVSKIIRTITGHWNG